MSPLAQLKHLDRPLDTHISLNGSDYLYFSGTAYLGIPQDVAFKKHYLEGISRYGLSNGTSRGNNIQLGIYQDAEDAAATYFGAAQTLITSSGFMAAQLAVKYFASFGKVLYAPKSHPSLWLNDQNPGTLGTFDEWAAQTVNTINGSTEEKWVLISNALNNLYPECYDFSFIKKIDPRKQVVLIVDDAHGIGLLNDGYGVFRAIPKTNHVEVVVVASMAKALGLDGGIVLGSNKTITQLKQTNTFLGASPPAPAGLYAFMMAKQIYREALEKLQERTALLASRIPGHWKFIPDFPVFFTQEKDSFAKLLEKQILISSFPYPDPQSEPVNRIVLNSRHTKENIERLILCL